MKRTPRPIALSLVLCASSFLTQPVDIGPPPGRLVDIDGRKLHIHCTGAGSSTVILEAGASSFAIDWALVQPEIARTNRVCSYDRAGQGWSESAASEGKSTGVPARLHAALQTADEKPPYVLVGASRGGLFVRLYQIQYPDEVVGMVLVDPAHEERLFTMLEGQAVTIASLTAEKLRSTLRPGPAAITRRSPQTGPPFDRLPRELYELRIKLDTRLIDSMPQSVPYETVAASAETERAQLAQLYELGKTKKHPLGDRPLVVLTRGEGAGQDLKDLHARAAKISANSRHTVVTGAGHEIHLFQPAVVIQAIQDVLEAVRSKEPLPPR